MPGTGVELSALNAPKTAISKERGAKCGALDDENESDLAKLIEIWPTLPKHVRTKIKGLIEKRSTGAKDDSD